MGEWSKWEFGFEELPNSCFIFGGTSSPETIQSVISSFDTIIFHKHDNYEAYIVEKYSQKILILFQVYGAAMVADLIFLLKDGGVKEIVFIGAAYGMEKQIAVGDFILPSRIQCLDGVASTLDNNEFSYPDAGLRTWVGKLFIENEISIWQGDTVSVPTTFYHPSSDKYDREVIALEMELASLCHYAFKTGIKACGVLVVSDTENHSLLADHELTNRNIIRAFQMIYESQANVQRIEV
ncbi:MAG: hypothetical protein ABFC94_12905 [Syntrophomonas sp.]